MGLIFNWSDNCFEFLFEITMCNVNIAVCFLFIGGTLMSIILWSINNKLKYSGYKLAWVTSDNVPYVLAQW